MEFFLFFLSSRFSSLEIHGSWYFFAGVSMRDILFYAFLKPGREPLPEGVRRAVQYSTHHDTRVLQWRVRQNPSVCSTEKSRWKQSPCKIYGLYWKSKVGCRWRMWMRISLNIVKEMLLDFNKCTRKQIWISVNTALHISLKPLKRSYIYIRWNLDHISLHKHRENPYPPVN